MYVKKTFEVFFSFHGIFFTEKENSKKKLKKYVQGLKRRPLLIEQRDRVGLKLFEFVWA